MQKNKNNKTKTKILESAEKLFAEKGFDKTSIDDIAKEAETTKSLFYYYFESKDNILYTLMKIRVEEAVKDLAERRKNGENLKTKEEIYEKCCAFVKQNESIFKIALFESLKTSKETNIIMELPKNVFKEFEDIFVFSQKEQLELILTVIKITTFWALRKNLCEKFNVTESELEEMYMKKI